MKTQLKFESTICHLYNIINAHKNKRAECLNENLLALLSIAQSQNIYYYIISWLLKNNDNLSETHKQQFHHDLLLNKTRNVLIKNQLKKLAQVFNVEKIPVLFLKGSAGLIRNLYDIESRYISDIDILIPEDKIGDAVSLLVSRGYNIAENSVPHSHHHLEPYHHRQHPAEIEIHKEPYIYSMLSRPAMPDIWGSADTVVVDHIPTMVPSITDHIWIAMRAERDNSVFIPKLKETIELSLILSKYDSYNIEQLKEYAERDYIPHILDAYSFTCNKYFEVEPFVTFDTKRMNEWSAWSIYQQKQINNRKLWQAGRMKFGSIFFFCQRGVVDKFKYLLNISCYEAIDKVNAIKTPNSVIVLWRACINCLEYLVFYIQYFWFSVFRMKNLNNNAKEIF